MAGTHGPPQDVTSRLIARYRDYFGLPTFTRTQRFPPELFHHFKSLHFVVLAIANQELRVLLEADDQEFPQWELVGGKIGLGESIEGCIDRLVRERTKLQIDQVHPLSVVVNQFTSGNKRVEHSGVAFLVEASGTAKARPGKKLQYVSSQVEHLKYLTNEEVLKAAFARLEQLSDIPPEEEIEGPRQERRRHVLPTRLLLRALHLWFVRPLGYLGSSRALRRAILRLTKDSKSVLDVACGDDQLILKIARQVEFCMANDVSWDTLSRVRAKCNQPNVLFTNQNLLNLSFQEGFDLVICKNTLHHMRDEKELRDAARVLEQLGRRLLIVDIEHPLQSVQRARWWNRYYVRFRGDAGGYFLTRDVFRRFIEEMYPDARVDLQFLSTIKGIYMVALIDLGQSEIDAHSKKERMGDAPTPCPYQHQT